MSGTTSGLLRRFLGAVTEQMPDVTRERMVYLADHRVDLAQILSEAFQLELSTYAITVDYSQSIEQMVAALRCDGYVNPEIKTANFGEEIKAKKSAKEDLEVVLLPFNREVTSQEVLDEMEKKGLRPATLAEPLAFGAKHPDFQREFPIVALGSSCVLHGDRRVACLWGSASGRSLSLSYFGHRWSARYRFLAVSK